MLQGEATVDTLDEKRPASLPPSIVLFHTAPDRFDHNSQASCEINSSNKDPSRTRPGTPPVVDVGDGEGPVLVCAVKDGPVIKDGVPVTDAEDTEPAAVVEGEMIGGKDDSEGIPTVLKVPSDVSTLAVASGPTVTGKPMISHS